METAIKAIGKGAKVSGGYGKVFVTDLLDVVKFYTDERGEEAL